MPVVSTPCNELLLILRTRLQVLAVIPFLLGQLTLTTSATIKSDPIKPIDAGFIQRALEPPPAATWDQIIAPQLKRRQADLEAAQRAAEALAAQQAAEAERQAQAVQVQATVAVYSGNHSELMAAAGIASSDYAAVEFIVNNESGWNANATNASSGAHGLPQALPYSKTGCGWTDAVCQLKWADNYAKQSYGGWNAAYNFWISHRWW